MYGHFAEVEDSPLPPFLHVDEVAAEQMSDIVGARPDEVAIMETLTANLHLMMASFYRPDAKKYKIILEGKAFPSDHVRRLTDSVSMQALILLDRPQYAVDSQIRHHNLDPASAMILLQPPSTSSPLLTTAHVLSVIDEHADSTALILLPGVQYYTGQYLDIPTITAHAHSHAICIGWDLAHAVGNVPLSLHDWDVDFAAWCNYKYINAGPGAIAGLFVHEKHGRVDMSAADRGEGVGYRPRLSGWWGGDKAVRFKMDNRPYFLHSPVLLPSYR